MLYLIRFLRMLRMFGYYTVKFDITCIMKLFKNRSILMDELQVTKYNGLIRKTINNCIDNTKHE